LPAGGCRLWCKSDRLPTLATSENLSNNRVRRVGLENGLVGDPYNSTLMPRRFIAVLILHFLLCVGFSAAGLNPTFSMPQDQVVAERSHHHDPAKALALSDADDHALMDDKVDLPDQLEPHTRASVDGAGPSAGVSSLVNTALSAITDPPHRPPKTFSGLFA
jgi:hypothetical protein